MEEALELARSGAWTIAEGEPPSVRLDHEVSNRSQFEKRDADYEIIRSMVEHALPDVFFKMPRAKLVAAAATASGRSIPTVKGHLLRYFHGGCSKAALLPRYDNCGAPGRSRVPGAAKRGRPVAEGHPPGLNVTPELRRIFSQAISRASRGIAATT